MPGSHTARLDISFSAVSMRPNFPKREGAIEQVLFGIRFILYCSDLIWLDKRAEMVGSRSQGSTQVKKSSSVLNSDSVCAVYPYTLTPILMPALFPAAFPPALSPLMFTFWRDFVLTNSLLYVFLILVQGLKQQL